jgi:hypothetical protein
MAEEMQNEPLTIEVTYPPQEQETEVQESSFSDYMNLLSPFGIQGKYEDTQTSVEDLDRKGINFSDPQFKGIFDGADIETRKEMLTARNNADALKIYDRRQIFMESQKRTAQDGLATQIAMGAIPALASPTTLIPFGGVFKVAQTANKARKLKMMAAGAGTATVANVLDEAMLDKQGMPTNYTSVAATSMILGGGLGLLGGMLTSPKAVDAAGNIVEAGSKLEKEYVSDNFVTIDRGTETILIPKVNKTLYDRIPGLGEWFKSPVVKMYQSDSSVVRGIASRISNPTVTLKDADGNFIVLPKTGADVKQEIIGNFNSKVNVPISKAYADWKAAGNTGTREEFNTEVYRVYTEESNRLASGSKEYADTAAVGDLAKIDETYKAEVKTAEMPEVFYKDSKGKLQPYTEALQKKQEQQKLELDEANANYQKFNDEEIPQLKEENKFIIELRQELLKAEGVKGKELISQMKEFRAMRNAQLKEQIKNRRAELKDAIKQKKYKEVTPIFKKPAKKVLKERKAELKKKRNEEREKAREKHVSQFYTDNPVAYKTNDAAVKQAAEAYAKYFDDMLEKGQNLKIKELMGSTAGRLYAPRNWDFGQIAKLPKEMVKQRLKLAVQSDARNEYNSQKDLDDDVESLYNILIDKNAESVMGQGKGYYTKDLPFEKKLSSRKLYVDESKLGDLVHNNFEDVAGMYNYFMSGRMAVQHAFSDMLDKNGDLDLSNITKKLQEEAYAKGEVVNAADLKTITNTVDDLLGVRRINQYGNDMSWKVSRNLMTYNSARLMGGAGGNQLIEMATIAMMNISRGIISKNFTESAGNVAKMLYQEKGTGSDLGQVLLNSGYLETALRAHRANRIADTEAGFNPKFWERKLDDLADFQMKYNGQRYFTALAEDLSGGAIMQYIQRASKRDEAMFARWGLTMEDVASLKKVLDKDNKNFLENMTQKQLDKFQLAINRGVSEWVVQPNSIHLPDWFKGAGPVQKLLFQFMKFPMIAQETLLRRGWTEDRAGMISGIVGAVTMYTTLKYLREEASVALGFTDERDRKYDIFNDKEQMYRTMLESTNYVANLGMFTTAWNYGNAFLQRPELGREWANRNAIEAIGGPTLGLMQDVSDIGSRIINDGDFTSERQINSYRQLIPFMALPGISEGGKALAEEFGD